MVQFTMKAARVNAGLFQSEAAKKIGVNTKTLLNWENGKTVPRADQFSKLCSIYGVPMDCIFLGSNST